MAKWEIRSIRGRSVFLCSHRACTEKASHYLVRLPEPNYKYSRESRSRRCEKHARQDAQVHRIALAGSEGGLE